MKSALGFLVAAKRCEIQGLEQLEVTSGLVKGVCEFVHVLQKERGTSNVFLASRGQRFGEQRQTRIEASVQMEAAVRAQFDQLDTDSGKMASGMRLFSRIAHVLHVLDALPRLRQRIGAQKIGADEATRSFNELIAGLLGVVFEAADTAADPLVSRALVALFNFMQGKELAGQERAAGAAGFALGRFDTAAQQTLTHLIEGQERCFRIFSEFADPTLCQIWRNVQTLPEVAEIERMRRLACAPSPQRLEADAADRWFDCASARIDAMRQVEDCATNALLSLCERKLEETRADLHDQKHFLDSLSASTGTQGAAVAVFFDSGSAGLASGPTDGTSAVLGADGLSPQLGRSVLDLVRAQAQRLQNINEELGTARAALHERKLVDRAKGLLMSQRGLSEEEAYRLLRQTAMNQNRRIADVAEATLALADFLKRD